MCCLFIGVDGFILRRQVYPLTLLYTTPSETGVQIASCSQFLHRVSIDILAQKSLKAAFR
jgi:hypothetical protein